MKKAILHIVFSTVLCGAAFGQQDPQFTQYMFNTLFLNPAYAGVDGVMRFTGVHRSQWLGYQSSFDDGGAPTTQLFSANVPIFKIHSGAGFEVMNDRSGPQNNLEVQGTYAYHLGLPNSKLSFGVRLGMFAQTLDFDMYRATDPDDPFLADKAGKDTQVRPDLSLGVYYRAEKYYVGAGVDHLLKSEFDFGSSLRNALESHMNVVAGYFYDVDFDLQIQPSVLIKTDFNEYSFDFSVLAMFRNTMWGGLSFRQSEAVILILGYKLLKDKSLQVGYSLDYIVKDREAKQPTSHELLLSYDLPVARSGKKIVRTPRYRH